jgi:hypothetical protein
MSPTLLDAGATLAHQHIDELLRDADHDRLVRGARRHRRERLQRVAVLRRLRPATAR